MMQLLGVVFAAGLIFLGAVAVFLGSVLSIAFWKTGVISLSWGAGTDQSRDVLLSAAPDEFWLYFVLIGLLPIVAGAGAIIVGRRMLRAA